MQEGKWVRLVSGLYNPPFKKIQVGILGKNWWGRLINSLSGHPVETQKMAFSLGLQKDVYPVQPERMKTPAGPGHPRKELHTATLRTDGAPHATPGSGTTLGAEALGSCPPADLWRETLQAALGGTQGSGMTKAGLPLRVPPAARRRHCSPLTALLLCTQSGGQRPGVRPAGLPSLPPPASEWHRDLATGPAASLAHLLPAGSSSGTG